MTKQTHGKNHAVPNAVGSVLVEYYLYQIKKFGLMDTTIGEGCKMTSASCCRIFVTLKALN